MPVLNPGHLLEQAYGLAAGASRQADLRRAISTTYYALFHTVAAAAADGLIGQAHRNSTRYALVYRTIEHRRLRELCGQIAAKNLAPKLKIYAPSGGFGQDIVEWSEAVIDLQEKRHLADYDPLFRVRASDAKLAIEAGRAALDRFAAADRAQKQAFLLLCVFTPR